MTQYAILTDLNRCVGVVAAGTRIAEGRVLGRGLVDLHRIGTQIGCGRVPVAQIARHQTVGTVCEQKIAQGELPQCVAQCGARARYFGDLEQGLDSFVGAGKVRSTLFQKEPISTPLTTLHATLQPRQPTQRLRSVRIAYWVHRRGCRLRCGALGVLHLRRYRQALHRLRCASLAQRGQRSQLPVHPAQPRMEG